MKHTRSGLVVDLILTFGVLMISGNPAALSVRPEAVFVGILIGLAAVASIRRVRSFRTSDLLVIVCFLVISSYHVIVFPLVLTATGGFIVKLLIAFLLTRVVQDLPYSFVEVITMVASFSLLFYLTHQVFRLAGVDIPSLLAAYSLTGPDIVHVGLHNFHTPAEAHRNSGPFWEPGAFAGFLLLGIAFLGAKRNLYTSRQYCIRLTLLFVALLTTQSTTGYLVAPIALLLQVGKSSEVFVRRRRLLAGLAVSTVALPLVALAWSTLPFLGAKVSSQMINADERGRGWELTRYGNILYDFSFIERRPLLGWSANPATKEGLGESDTDLAQGQGNGLSGFAVRFGILGLLLFSAATYRSLWRLFVTRFHAALGLGLILLLLMGEQFLNYPLFFALMFIVPRQSGTRRAIAFQRPVFSS